MQRLQELIDRGWVLQVKREGPWEHPYIASIGDPSPDIAVEAVTTAYFMPGPTVAEALLRLDAFTQGKEGGQ
jgi:hypothetical protein